MTHRICLCHDYFVRWPVKIDELYDDEVRENISSQLEKDIEGLAAWWQDTFAVAITDPPTEPLPEDVRELQARNASILKRLARELGNDYRSIRVTTQLTTWVDISDTQSKWVEPPSRGSAPSTR